MSGPAFEKIFSDVKSIGFFGLGKTNSALIKRMPKNIKITLRSEREIPASAIPRGVKISGIFEGGQAFSDIDEEILFLSPSVRRERAELSAAAASGVRFCSDLEIFLKENKRKILAVSGSDGKSTTVTLTSALLSDKRHKNTPLGNIGTPFCYELWRKRGYAVLELSSFQLTYDIPRAKRAALTNITENHLDWHKDFEEYKNVKLSLLENAEEAVINADDPILRDFARGKEIFAVTSAERGAKRLASEFKAELFLTAEGGKILRNGVPILSLAEIKRREEHNIKNLLSALALTDKLIPEENIRKVVREFSGLAHRCELFLEADGIKYINSSIDTSPARTAATLASLPSPLIVILGGKGKGVGYGEIRKSLKKARLAILCGENREEIARDIRGCVDIVTADSFEDAVLYGASVAKPCDSVVLSPASTSYDSFRSFEERGEKFKEIIIDFYKNRQK